MRRRFPVATLSLVFSIIAVGSAPDQSSDALRDRVAQLVARLGGGDLAARDAAEKSLIELGARVLPILDEAPVAAKPGAPGADQEARLDRVRAAIAEAGERVNLGASIVTLKGTGLRLSEALKQLQAASGNSIVDLREQYGAEVTNPAIDVDLVDRPFFEVLDAVARKGGVSVSSFTGDGTIGIMAGAMPGATDNPGPAIVPLYSGPFRVQLRQVAAVRDFAAGTGSANLQVELAWEPRLRPMILAIKGDGITGKTDDGKPLVPTVSGESNDVVLRPENPSAEVNLNIEPPDRAARRIESFAVRGEVTLPAGLKTFRFNDLAARDARIKQGEIAVTMQSVVVEEDTWKVGIIVEYPGTGPAFESYRQGLFNNRIWLQRADGSRFELNGGMNDSGVDGGRLAFEYLFVAAPGKPADYAVVYETPSRIVSIPLMFEFKDIPLP